MPSENVTRKSALKRFYLPGGVGVVVLAVIVFAAVWWWPQPSLTPVAVVTEKPAAPRPASHPVPPAQAAAKPAPAPSFDVVRIDPSGNAVIAGRAAPGSKVTVLDGGRDIGHVTADAGGSWVLLPTKPLPPGRRTLTLSARGKDGKVTPSTGMVAMMVPESPASPGSGAGADAPVPPSAKPGSPTTAAAPVAILLPKEGPAKPLQLPPLKGKNPLSLDVIEYGAKGDVTIEGRSAPQAKVEAFLDDKKVGKATADSKGQWTITAGKEVPAGRYRLKLEAQNGPESNVTQLTTPFERAIPPATLASDMTVVQPGNSLWRIARRTYGHGVRYVLIYHANQHQIRDPNLIFPGQLLTVPDKS